MRRICRWISRYWFWFSLGCILTRIAAERAYIERGYKAIGGEWLILPMILLLVWFVRDLAGTIRRMKEEEEHERRITEYRRRVQGKRLSARR